SKSAQLRVEDVRAIVRILGECRDLGDDPTAWQQHLFQSVARLLGSALVTGGDMVGRWGRPTMISLFSWGWENGVSQHAWLQGIAHFRDDPTFSQVCMRYMERFRQEDGVAHARSDLVSDREWEASAEYQCSRRMGVNHTMGCFRMLPGAKDRFR